MPPWSIRFWIEHANARDRSGCRAFPRIIVRIVLPGFPFVRPISFASLTSGTDERFRERPIVLSESLLDVPFREQFVREVVVQVPYPFDEGGFRRLLSLLD